MRGRLAVAGLAAMWLVSSSVAVQAQGAVRSGTQKLFVGLALGGSSLNIDDEDISVDEQGGGGAFRIGYGFTRLFALYLEGAAASLEDEGDEFTLSHVDLGARFHFGGPERAFIPFLDVGFTARAVSADDFILDENGTPVTGDLEISGSGLSFGGGFLWYFNPQWALDLGLKVTTGEFDTVKLNNVSVSGLDVDATSSRLQLGITWFPMSGR